MRGVILLSLLFGYSLAFANNKSLAPLPDDYYKIDSIEVFDRTPIKNKYDQISQLSSACSKNQYFQHNYNPQLEMERYYFDPKSEVGKIIHANNISGAIGTITGIVNLGIKIWKLIEDNKPVVKYEGPDKTASAVPENIQHWSQLECWLPPQVKTHEVIYKNLYGIEVVKFKYKFFFIPGGQQNGQGLYLAGIQVIPEQISVAWGYNFHAKAEVEDILNMGSHKDPIAGATIKIQWNVKTAIKEMISTKTIFVTGAGDIYLQ